MPTTATAIQINGIDCWDEGVVENFGRPEASVVRTIVATWDDSATLINYLCGNVAPAGQISLYQAPAPYPRAPWLYVWSIKTEQVPVGGLTNTTYPNGDLVSAMYAQMRVEYRTLDYNPAETGSQSLDYAMDWMMPSRTTPSFQWATGSTATVGTSLPATDSPALRITTIGFVRTRKNLPTIPSTLIRQTSVAPLNSAAFEGAEVGTVLFEGAQAVRRLTAAGAEAWDMTYKFSYKNCGADSSGGIASWNALFCPQTGKFEQIVAINGGLPPFNSSDLNQLLM